MPLIIRSVRRVADVQSAHASALAFHMQSNSDEIFLQRHV